jgi:type I restriction enzyme S subunit
LLHFVSGPVFQRRIEAGSAGGIQSFISLGKLRETAIDLPTPQEQEVIANCLDEADALVAALNRLITKKQAIKQGMMQQLLTGRARLPGFTQQWHTTEVGELLEFKNGLNKASEYFGSGTPIVNFMDVMNNPIITADDVVGKVTLTRDEIKRFSARRGDLFFTRTSETVEEVGTAAALVDEICDASFSGFILRGRPVTADIDSRFLALAFQLDSVRKQVISAATYTTRALTNGRSLSRVVIDLPPFAEQTAITDVIGDSDAEIAALQKRVNKARDVKTGMMQQLLTGRIRLAVKAPS